MVTAIARAVVVLALACTAVTLVALFAPGGTERARACGAAGPYDFDTWEAEDYVSFYNRAIELVAAGKAITNTYSLNGESIDVRYQGLVSGPRSARTTTADPSLPIPPTIMKSIAWIEASWTNASSAVPFGGVGPALRSFDCGYGLGQITTGMANTNGTATARQVAIGTHFLFNLAEGARILADKWNSAPRFRPIAGEGNPAYLEDWYYAIWSYNGFAFTNHPLNPNRDPLRGGSEGTSHAIYHCEDSSAPSYQAQANGRPKFGYGDYTYPERAYGCLQYPPRRAPVGAPSGTPRVALYTGQAVSMPDLSSPEVASAFEPERFLACQQAGFSGGCPDMDFPTTVPGDCGEPPEDGEEATQIGDCPPKQTPHLDTTPPVDAGLAAAFLGAPSLVINAPESADLSVSAEGVVSQVTVTIENIGTWLGPYRIRTSASWLVVRHPGDSASRTLDGGIVVGAETEVVTQSPSAGPPARARQAQDGYTATLIVTLDSSRLTVGTHEGTVWIEPLYGGGAPRAIAITAVKEQPVDAPAIPDEPRPYRAIITNVVNEGPQT